MPSRDAQWVIGTVLAAVVALYAGIGGQFDALRDDVRRLETRLEARIDALDARLRAVEVELGKVVQRLATLERLHLPTADD